MQGAQKLRSEAHLQVRRNDEVEAHAADGLFTKPSRLVRSIVRGRLLPSRRRRIDYLQTFLYKPSAIESGAINSHLLS
jgi:hypothetical protein